MPVYTCPDCSTKLKRSEPLPAGKKLRCPECGNVFAPAAKAAAPKAAKPAAAPAPRAAAEEEQDTASAQARHEIAFSPIKERFKRSARGPALVLVVKPSDWLLRTGVGICVAAIAGALWAVWPMIFKIEDVQPPDKNKLYSQ